MMSLKFAANISTLFQHVILPERFAEAKCYGFNAVEMQFPYTYEVDVLKCAKESSAVEQVLINSPTGSEKEFGFGAVPKQEEKFLNSFKKAMVYATALSCKKVHILAGFKNADFTQEDHVNTFIQNLKSVSDILNENNMTAVIEPLSPEVKPNYFLSSFDTATEILEQVEKPNIKLLLDVYHLQKITGDAVENIDKYYSCAGHIQISQDPHRYEPSYFGKIDYNKIFAYLKEKNHNDFIGLEYFPSDPNDIKSCFMWMENV